MPFLLLPTRPARCVACCLDMGQTRREVQFFDGSKMFSFVLVSIKNTIYKQHR